jgi:hypothetical protein
MTVEGSAVIGNGYCRSESHKIKPRLAGAAVRRAIFQGNENAGDTVKKTADAIKEAGANANDAVVAQGTRLAIKPRKLARTPPIK